MVIGSCIHRLDAALAEQRPRPFRVFFTKEFVAAAPTADASVGKGGSSTYPYDNTVGYRDAKGLPGDHHGLERTGNEIFVYLQ